MPHRRLLLLCCLTLAALPAAGCGSFSNSRLLPQNWFKSDTAEAKPPMRVLVTSKHPSTPGTTAATRVDPYSAAPAATAATPAAGNSADAAAPPTPSLTHGNTIPNAKDVGL